MKKLYVVGAGGLGREIFHWAHQVLPSSRDWELEGFLDDNLQALNGFNYPKGVLGTIEGHRPRQDELFVIGVGTPKIRLALAESLLSRGAQFATIIHPSSVLGHAASLGQGCVIGPHSLVSCDTVLGDFVILTGLSNVGHDVHVGAGTTICGHVDLSGGAKIGRAVFLGSHAAVLPGVTVGDFAKVGAGSVVLRKVRSETTVFGLPASTI